MNKIDIQNWKEFQVKDFFDIHPTKAYDLTNAYLMSDFGENPVVVNSQYNNGIGGYTEQNTTEKAGIVTFSDTTSANTIFYQPNDFVGYPHVQGMYPIGKYKEKWSKYSLLFFVTVFRVQANLLYFDFVNKFTREDAKKMKIKLPVTISDEPDFLYMETYIKNLQTKVSTDLGKLKSVEKQEFSKINIYKWRKFHIYDIFEIDSGTKLDNKNMTTINPTINLINRTGFDNGVVLKVDEIKNLKPYESGLMTLSLGGALLGACFIQKEKFYTGQNVVVLRPKKNISYFSKLFIATTITKESRNNYKAFEKELNKYIKRDFEFLLPVTTKSEPDYQYMDKYISKLYEVQSKKLKLF